MQRESSSDRRAVSSTCFLRAPCATGSAVLMAFPFACPWIFHSTAFQVHWSTTTTSASRIWRQLPVGKLLTNRRPRPGWNDFHCCSRSVRRSPRPRVALYSRPRRPPEATGRRRRLLACATFLTLRCITVHRRALLASAVTRATPCAAGTRGHSSLLARENAQFWIGIKAAPDAGTRRLVLLD